MSYNERDGKSGFGVVIQDINATGKVCFDKINDLKNYHKMVPHVKGVDIYEESTLSNVSIRHRSVFIPNTFTILCSSL